MSMELIEAQRKYWDEVVRHLRDHPNKVYTTQQMDSQIRPTMTFRTFTREFFAAQREVSVVEVPSALQQHSKVPAKFSLGLCFRQHDVESLTPMLADLSAAPTLQQSARTEFNETDSEMEEDDNAVVSHHTPKGQLDGEVLAPLDTRFRSFAWGNTFANQMKNQPEQYQCSLLLQKHQIFSVDWNCKHLQPSALAFGGMPGRLLQSILVVGRTGEALPMNVADETDVTTGGGSSSRKIPHILFASKDEVVSLIFRFNPAYVSALQDYPSDSALLLLRWQAANAATLPPRPLLPIVVVEIEKPSKTAVVMTSPGISTQSNGNFSFSLSPQQTAKSVTTATFRISLPANEPSCILTITGILVQPSLGTGNDLSSKIEVKMTRMGPLPPKEPSCILYRSLTSNGLGTEFPPHLTFFPTMENGSSNNSHEPLPPPSSSSSSPEGGVFAVPPKASKQHRAEGRHHTTVSSNLLKAEDYPTLWWNGPAYQDAFHRFALQWSQPSSEDVEGCLNVFTSVPDILLTEQTVRHQAQRHERNDEKKKRKVHARYLRFSNKHMVARGLDLRTPYHTGD